MINAPQQVQAQTQVVSLLKPVYDTYDGKQVTLPCGFRVKVLGQSTKDFYSIEAWTPEGLVKVIAPFDALFPTVPTTPIITEPQEPIASQEQDPYPLKPRIYQEFGITWLLHSKQGILADAPGVGKTLACTEAASRVMTALKNNKDPLAYCYPMPFSLDKDYQEQLEDNHSQSNPHPDSHPMWALPTNSWPNVLNKDDLNPITIIVAPTHLCKMWFKHIRKQYPNDSITLATEDTRSKRLSAIDLGCRWIIVNYEMLRPIPEPKKEDYEIIETPHSYGGITIMRQEVGLTQEAKLRRATQEQELYTTHIARLKPVCIIFDESHRLKSSKSRQAKHAALFSRSIPYRFLATATPIKREADDLYMQLHIVNPSMFAHEADFLERYAMFDQTTYGKKNVQLRTPAKRALWVNRVGDPTEIASSNKWLQETYGTQSVNKAYHTNFMNPNLKGYILGRSYKDVGLYLPDVIPAQIPVMLDDSIREVYESTKNNWRASFAKTAQDNSYDDSTLEDIPLSSMMAVLHSLRHLTGASENKFEAVKQLIDDNPGPHLIYCEYDEHCAYLANRLGTKGISGLQKPEQRLQIALDCIAQGKPVVATGRSIGTGVNGLEQCKTIIHFEEDYTPGEQYQRDSRVQRFDPTLARGETKDPILLFFVNVTNSIDEHVHEVRSDRTKSIKDIIKVELHS